MGFREYGKALDPAFHMIGQRIKQAQFFNFIVKQFNPQCQAVGFSRENIDHIPPYPEGGTVELKIIAFILQFSQPLYNKTLTGAVAHLQMKHHFKI